eukprot:766450-Hanusia_phi.AAC.1
MSRLASGESRREAARAVRSEAEPRSCEGSRTTGGCDRRGCDESLLQTAFISDIKHPLSGTTQKGPVTKRCFPALDDLYYRQKSQALMVSAILKLLMPAI